MSEPPSFADLKVSSSLSDYMQSLEKELVRMGVLRGFRSAPILGPIWRDGFVK
jgi:hypothetical protein